MGGGGLQKARKKKSFQKSCVKKAQSVGGFEASDGGTKGEGTDTLRGIEALINRFSREGLLLACGGGG